MGAVIDQSTSQAVARKRSSKRRRIIIHRTLRLRPTRLRECDQVCVSAFGVPNLEQGTEEIILFGGDLGSLFETSKADCARS